MNIRRCFIIGAMVLLGAGCATVTEDIKVDAETNPRVPVWFGTATGDIQEKPTVEMARKRLDYAVTKMFQKTSQNQDKPRRRKL